MGGLYEKTEEETPQGGWLSPLLADIMLDNLDKDLETGPPKAIDLTGSQALALVRLLLSLIEVFCWRNKNISMAALGAI